MNPEIDPKMRSVTVTRGFDEASGMSVDEARLRAALETLDADLTKMLPRSSDTMSASRQRDITEFVQRRLREALTGKEQE